MTGSDLSIAVFVSGLSTFRLFRQCGSGSVCSVMAIEDWDTNGMGPMGPVVESQPTGRKTSFEIFDTAPCSIEERFPGETGRRLQDAVWELYAIEESATAKLFLPDHSKTFVRHKLNDRDEHDTRNHYTQLILRHGWLKGVRGPPWAIAEKIRCDGELEGESVRYHLISSATLMEAVTRIGLGVKVCGCDGM